MSNATISWRCLILFPLKLIVSNSFPHLRPNPITSGCDCLSLELIGSYPGILNKQGKAFHFGARRNKYNRQRGLRKLALSAIARHDSATENTGVIFWVEGEEKSYLSHALQQAQEEKLAPLRRRGSATQERAETQLGARPNLRVITRRECLLP